MNDRMALIIGVDYYEYATPLYGCTNDANALYSVLDRNEDGKNNFDIKKRYASTPDSQITKNELKSLATSLFQNSSEIALFYFSGHGFIDNLGGHLVTSECESGDDGFRFDDLLQLANESPARNKILILDCCHAGLLGKNDTSDRYSSIANGVTILPASDEHQYATQKNGQGVFTQLLVDALYGSAADLIGHITPGSIYAHIDQALGTWKQRPLFKANVRKFISLRSVKPPIELNDLHKITSLFKKPDKKFKLNPTFEITEQEIAVPKNVKKFKILQKYNRLNLVVPIDEEHMYYAAIHSTGCTLTRLGKHYWNLVDKGML
jgi:hypothetical protein